MTSVAKKAVDSTLRKIATYTAEIFASIIILILICLPLSFAVVGWIQHVLYDVPLGDVALRPVAMFGVMGTALVTIGLGILSFILVHFTSKRLFGKEEASVEESTPTEEEEVDEDAEEAPEEEEEEVEEEDAAEEESEEGDVVSDESEEDSSQNE